MQNNCFYRFEKKRSELVVSIDVFLEQNNLTKIYCTVNSICQIHTGVFIKNELYNLLIIIYDKKVLSINKKVPLFT